LQATFSRARSWHSISRRWPRRSLARARTRRRALGWRTWGSGALVWACFPPGGTVMGPFKGGRRALQSGFLNLCSLCGSHSLSPPPPFLLFLFDQSYIAFTLSAHRLRTCPLLCGEAACRIFQSVQIPRSRRCTACSTGELGGEVRKGYTG
jgi:hypothetical protein